MYIIVWFERNMGGTVVDAGIISACACGAPSATVYKTKDDALNAMDEKGTKGLEYRVVELEMPIG